MMFFQANSRPLWLRALIFLVCMFPLQSLAQTLDFGYDTTNEIKAIIDTSEYLFIASAFTVGTTDIQINTIQYWVFKGDGEIVTIAIYSNKPSSIGGSNEPDSMVVSGTFSPSNVGITQYRIGIPTTTLSANTKYWVVVDGAFENYVPSGHQITTPYGTTIALAQPTLVVFSTSWSRFSALSFLPYEIGFVNGNIQGDPHVVGLDGSRFDFTGEKGNVYAILSSPGFQLNAEFIESQGMTYLGRIGARFGNNDTLEYLPSDELYYNRVKVETTDEWFTKETNWGKYHKTKRHFIIETEFWQIKGGPTSDDVLDFSFNNLWQVSYVGPWEKINKIHGLVGHTIRPRIPVKDCYEHEMNGGCQIEGYASDYVVTDGLFGTKFSFSQFASNSKETEKSIRYTLHSVFSASISSH